jgi:beta-glucosidase
MKLIERSAQIAAQEASADGINWTFPNGWYFGSRAGAGFLKVPAKIRFLGSQIAKARKDIKVMICQNNTILSCVKHFALYGAPEAGRL